MHICKKQQKKSPVDLELANFLATIVSRLASSDGSFFLLFDLVRQAGCQTALSWLDRAAKVLDVRFARLRRIDVAVATAIQNERRRQSFVIGQKWKMKG
jgi:hypothetical protein